MGERSRSFRQLHYCYQASFSLRNCQRFAAQSTSTLPVTASRNLTFRSLCGRHLRRSTGRNSAMRYPTAILYTFVRKLRVPLPLPLMFPPHRLVQQGDQTSQCDRVVAIYSSYLPSFPLLAVLCLSIQPSWPIIHLLSPLHSILSAIFSCT